MFHLRELAVGINAYLMGMAALLSASVPHKAEADNGLMLLIFTTVSLWLSPSGASEKLWHYAGKQSARTIKEKWRWKFKPA